MVLCYTARMSFVDKVVLVTGAGRDLGRHLAQQFARDGARVVVNDVNPDTSAATVRAIEESGGKAMAIVADVANKMAVQTMHYEILDTWGRVDILINHANVDPGGAALTLDEWAWDRALNVNLKGAFLCTQTVGRSMKEQGGGVVVNMVGLPGERHSVALAASTSGLFGFTRECAEEFAAYNILINAVFYGMPLAQWIAPSREAQVGQKTADLVMFLSSLDPKSSRHTGEVFLASGEKY